MRKKQYEITDPAVIELILSGSEVCRIAMIDNDRPYIVPMNYGYKNNVIYFHSADEGKKIGLLRANKKVCFEIEYFSEILKNEIPCDWSSKYRSVIGYGTIEFITDTEGKKEALDIIMAHYGKTGENIYKDSPLERVLILKLIIEEISGKELGNWN